MTHVRTGLEFWSTDRLDARPVTGRDYDLLHAMHRDPDVMATLGGRQNDAYTRHVVDLFAGHWRDHGWGVWLFDDRETGEFVGRAGLRNVRVDGIDCVELLYALNAPWWGRGLASEMADAIVAKGFGEIGLHEIASFTLPTNMKSRRVMEKAGFTYQHDIIHANLPHVFYVLKRVALNRERRAAAAG